MPLPIKLKSKKREKKRKGKVMKPPEDGGEESAEYSCDIKAMLLL